MQDQEEFIHDEEQQLIEDMQISAEDPSVDEGNSSGNHEIKGVILRALSLEVDRCY